MAMRLNRSHALEAGHGHQAEPRRPEAAADFSASITDDEDVMVLRGCLDGAAGPVLQSALADHPNGDLVVDLTDVTRADTAGLSHLVRLRNQRPGTHQRIVLLRPQPQVRTQLSTAGLDRVFPIRD
jgi:anti-anti-sigma factor